MALDIGGVTALYRTGEFDPSEAPRSSAPDLLDGPDLGSALRTVREFHGVSLQDLADATRIRQTYLSALEAMRLDELPSRPFAVGYVRAYARHLGLDAEAAVERFRQEFPEHDEGLRAPIGVRRERDPRLGLILAFGVLIVAAIVLWNIAQRGITDKTPHAAVAPVASAPVAPAATPEGPLAVGAPLPPPVESTTPNLYETPGLPTGEDGAAQPSDVDAKALAAAQAVALSMTPGTPFRAKGQIYGAGQSPAATVLIQARRNATLVVRGQDGSVYFSNVLQAGEAYRAPPLKGVIVDADPTAFDVFVAGGYKGPLTGPSSSLSALVN
jgi:transcriptional regulator with XRE-family HTH domain